jgi:hypothetical protein
MLGLESEKGFHRVLISRSRLSEHQQRLSELLSLLLPLLPATQPWEDKTSKHTAVNVFFFSSWSSNILLMNGDSQLKRLEHPLSQVYPRESICVRPRPARMACEVILDGILHTPMCCECEQEISPTVDLRLGAPIPILRIKICTGGPIHATELQFTLVMQHRDLQKKFFFLWAMMLPASEVLPYHNHTVK